MLSRLLIVVPCKYWIPSQKSRDNSLHKQLTKLDFGSYRIKDSKSFITLSQNKDFLFASGKKLFRLFWQKLLILSAFLSEGRDNSKVVITKIIDLVISVLKSVCKFKEI